MKLITLADAKLYLKIESDYTDDDDLINSIIDSVGGFIDSYLNRNLQRKPVNADVIPVPCSSVYEIKVRDHVPGTDQIEITELQSDSTERVVATNPTTRISNISGYIRWCPSSDIEINDRNKLFARITPVGDQPVPDGIKMPARVLVHSLYSHRTTMIGAEQNNLAEKFLMSYRHYI